MSVLVLSTVKQRKINKLCRKVAQVLDIGVEEFKANFLISWPVDDCILKRKDDGEEEVNCEACIKDNHVMTFEFCPECVFYVSSL